MTATLDPGQAFPTISALDMDGNPVNMSESVAGSWGVILFYRGHW